MADQVPGADQNGVERQDHRLLGPEWEGAGPPPPGFFNKRLANEALQAILTDARRGALELARTGIMFAQATDDWMEWGIYQRNWKPATIVDRRLSRQRHLLPAFGSLRIEQITTRRLERWKAEFLRETGKRRQCAKLLAVLRSIMDRAQRVHGLPSNPVADVERVRVAYDAARFDFYSPEEVYALARAAASEQDAAIFLTATSPSARSASRPTTRSAPWRSTGPASSRSRCGWATPARARRCAICTTRARRPRPRCSLAHSGPPKPRRPSRYSRRPSRYSRRPERSQSRTVGRSASTVCPGWKAPEAAATVQA